MQTWSLTLHDIAEERETTFATVIAVIEMC